jgi:hypothetical protein
LFSAFVQVIAFGTSAQRVTLPQHFALSVNVLATILASTAGQYLNILDIRDQATGEKLLSLYTTNTRALWIKFGNVVLDTAGPMLPSTYTGQWATLVIELRPGGKLAFYTSNDVNAVSVYDVAPYELTDMASRVFTVFASNAEDGTSSGYLMSFNVLGAADCMIHFFYHM